MNLLITGGCGFLGSNLARRGLDEGWRVTVFDNMSRIGTQDNLGWLRAAGDIAVVHGDIRDPDAVSSVVVASAPEVIFHLAGQVAMTTSLQNPRADFEINALGTLNVLEAVRTRAPQASLIYSSTNKVYGDLSQFTYEETETRYCCSDHPRGFDEETPLSFHSPYGCSKGAADQYILDYSRLFGVRGTVFRHSSMYGGRQYATFDQGWVGWFCRMAAETRRGLLREPFHIAGNGKQVRDVLHADDLVSLYFAAASQPTRVAGQAFNIGGGLDNSLSLLELFQLLGSFIGQRLRFACDPPRQSDQRVFIADLTRITSAIGWSPRVRAHEGVRDMYEWTEGMYPDHHR